jgi:hypothetical protein
VEKTVRVPTTCFKIEQIVFFITRGGTIEPPYLACGAYASRLMKPSKQKRTLVVADPAAIARPKLVKKPPFFF